MTTRVPLDGRLDDGLFRRYMTVSDLVARGELSAAGAVRVLVTEADKMKRPRTDVARYVKSLHGLEPNSVAVPVHWERQEQR